MTNDFPSPRRQCHAWWCEADACVGSILCATHHAILLPEQRGQLRAAIAAAIGYVASVQMSTAVRRMPEDVRERLREEAKKL